ncbi:MAG: hypothetical protein IKD50_07505, partial [Clostridia bacterium]|nr:hypothetical protein [Clostridia bacterium]
MKKILSILLALMMLFSVTALAENGSGSTPPGGAPGGEMGTPPDKPEGGMPGGNPPDGAPGGGFGGGTPPGGGASSFEYAAATEITEAAEQAGQTYTSDTVDESALIVNTTDAVTITSPTVTKAGDSNGGDSCNFYGLNAAMLVMGGSTATITGG